MRAKPKKPKPLPIAKFDESPWEFYERLQREQEDDQEDADEPITERYDGP